MVIQRGKPPPYGRFQGGTGLYNNNSVSVRFLEVKAFPPRLLRGALPLPAGTPRNAPCPPIPGLATSSHGGLARFVPHTDCCLLAARGVQSTVLPLPVERRRRHGMPTATVPPCGHPGGNQLPAGRWCSCQPRLASLRCARLGSWEVPQRAKDKGFPRVCRMRAATCIAVLPSVLGGSCLTALDLVLHALWLF